MPCCFPCSTARFDLLQNRLLKTPRMVGIGPIAIVERDPQEVESQVRDIGEVAFIEQRSAPAAVGDGQIKASPVGQLPRRGIGQLGTLLVRFQCPGGHTA